MRTTIPALALLAGALMIAPAGATDEAKSGKHGAKWRQVSGKVTQTKEIEVRGAKAKNLVVQIATNKNDRRLAVDLGTVDAGKVSKGDRLEAEGRMVRIRDRSFFVARRAKLDGEELKIARSEQEKTLKTTRTEKR